jgi:hypothetical protein
MMPPQSVRGETPWHYQGLEVTGVGGDGILVHLGLVAMLAAVDLFGARTDEHRVPSRLFEPIIRIPQLHVLIVVLH